MNQQILNVLGTAVCTLALALPLCAAGKAKHERTAWPAEEMTGHITMVQPAQHLVVVTDAQGVSFDLRVTPSTRIRVDGRREKPADLAGELNHSVTVRMRPEARGDIARTLNVQS